MDYDDEDELDLLIEDKNDKDLALDLLIAVLDDDDGWKENQLTLDELTKIIEE